MQRCAIERPQYSGSSVTYSSPHPKPSRPRSPQVSAALQRVLANRGELENLPPFNHDSLVNWSERTRDVPKKAEMVPAHPERISKQRPPSLKARRFKSSLAAPSALHAVRPLTPDQVEERRRNSTHEVQRRDGPLEMSVFKEADGPGGNEETGGTEVKSKRRGWWR